MPDDPLTADVLLCILLLAVLLSALFVGCWGQDRDRRR